MITNVSMSSLKPMTNFNVAFGQALLTKKGRDAADTYGFTKNMFLRDLGKKQKGRLTKTPLYQALSNGASYEQIVQAHGCSNNAKQNADFIKYCALDNKAQKILKKGTTQEDLKAGLLTLWDKNYDNPELSKKDTEKLLELIKEDMDAHIYLQNKAILTDAK